MSNDERDARDSAPYVCPDCGGPSQMNRGTTHKWRCRECVEHVIGLDRPPAARDLPKWLVPIGNREGVLK